MVNTNRYVRLPEGPTITISRGSGTTTEMVVITIDYWRHEGRRLRAHGWSVVEENESDPRK